MQKTIHHYGTFDVDNYGDLLFPKILSWRLWFAGTEHISPTGRRSCFRDSSENRVAPQLPALATITGGGNIVRFNRTGLDIYSGCSRTAYPKLSLEPAATASDSRVPHVINAPSIASDRLYRIEKLLLSRVLDAASYIAFRDRNSVEIASSLTDNTVHLVPDTAFDISRMWPEFRNDQPARSDYAVFHINSRYGGKPEVIARAIDQFCAQTGLKVVLLPIGPCHGDHEYAQQIHLAVRGRAEIVDDFDLKAFANTIAQSALYIGSSMHGFITAASYGVPCGLVLGQRYMTKFDGVLGALDMPPDVIAETWEDVCRLAGTLRAPAPDTLDAVFKRLDSHWNAVESCITIGGSERKFSAVSAYSLLRMKDFKNNNNRMLKRVARSMRLRQ